MRAIDDRLARAVVLYLHPGRWSAEQHEQWYLLTGMTTATRDNLLDLASAVIEEADRRRDASEAGRCA